LIFFEEKFNISAHQYTLKRYIYSTSS